MDGLLAVVLTLYSAFMLGVIALYATRSQQHAIAGAIAGGILGLGYSIYAIVTWLP